MGDATTDLLSRIDLLEARLRAVEAAQSREGEPATATARPAHPATEPSSRRDVFRLGVVALGAAAAGLAAGPAEAANGAPVLIGAANDGTLPTVVRSSADGLSALEGQSSGASGAVGVSGRCSGGAGVGVLGFANGSSGTGVFGSAPATNGVAVYGLAGAASGTTTGVRGECVSPAGFAMHGRNFVGGTAMLGELPGIATQNGIAVYGLNSSSYVGPSPGAGGFGVYGLSAKGHGLVGATAAAGAAAVVGATNGVAGAFAGAFYGPLIVGGDFTVVGGAKSAAVPHPDGSHRRLYCVESPESWFEDFGRGTLACGKAAVALDPDFAALVDAADYLVFITGNDGRSDLSVCDRTSMGFVVKATAADAEGTFSWRVVAKRKDIAGPRLELVDVPKEPTLPEVPASVYEPPPTRDREFTRVHLFRDKCDSRSLSQRPRSADRISDSPNTATTTPLP